MLEAYIGLSDAYTANGEPEKASEALTAALRDVEDEEALAAIHERLTAIMQTEPSLGKTWQEQYDLGL